MRRRVRRFLFWSAVAAVGLPLAIACGQEVSIPEPHAPDATTPSPDSGTDSAQAPDTSVTKDAGEDAADVTCPDVVPDDATGIFVTPTGTNSATCGTRTTPCQTLTHAVTRAGAAFRTKVYAARGTYVERLALAANVEVIGGWNLTGGTSWKRACVKPDEIVVVRAPTLQNVTVEARDLGGEARLSLLKIESKSAADLVPGESVYGVVAIGTTTTLVMNNVVIDTGNAGAGANGPNGDAGAVGPATCTAGAGAPGTVGAQGAGAPAGQFDPASGYTAGAAGPGGAGTAGGNGTASKTPPTCVTCGTCALNALMAACIFTANPPPQACGKEGTPGCGGGPAEPGGPAKGGGSSVGVFAWDANVTINGSKVKSGDAGNGGLGGLGGAGGAGTLGAAGASTAPCVVGCTFNAANVACDPVMGRGDGGAAGDAGALGGAGGPGGGGGGGSSFAIYQGGAGFVTTGAGTTLTHGKSGKGGGPDGGAGTMGAAADRVP
jgi:hypothetical protein